MGFVESMSWHGVVPDSFRNSESDNRTRNCKSSQLSSFEQIEAVRSGQLDAGFVFTIANIRSRIGATRNRFGQPDVGSAERTSADKVKKSPPAGFERCSFIWFPRRESPPYYDRLMHECFRGGLKSPHIVQEGGERSDDSEPRALPLVICGFGFGLALAPVNAAVLASTDHEVHGLATRHRGGRPHGRHARRHLGPDDDRPAPLLRRAVRHAGGAGGLRRQEPVHGVHAPAQGGRHRPGAHRVPRRGRVCGDRRRAGPLLFRPPPRGRSTRAPSCAPAADHYARAPGPGNVPPWRTALRRPGRGQREYADHFDERRLRRHRARRRRHRDLHGLAASTRCGCSASSPGTPRSSATPAAGSPRRRSRRWCSACTCSTSSRILVIPHTRCAMATSTPSRSSASASAIGRRRTPRGSTSASSRTSRRRSRRTWRRCGPTRSSRRRVGVGGFLYDVDTGRSLGAQRSSARIPLRRTLDAMRLLERELQLGALPEYAADARRGRRSARAGAPARRASASPASSRPSSTARRRRLAWTSCDGSLHAVGPRAAAGHGRPVGRRGPGRRAEGDHARPVFAALLSMLREHGDHGGLSVLVVEDLHFADEATLDLVRHLARRLRGGPVLMVATYRDDGLGREPRPAREPRRRSRRCAPPGGSTSPRSRPRAVAELAEASGRRARRAVHALTGGNPFFVSEVLSRRDRRAAAPRRATRCWPGPLGCRPPAASVLDAAALVGERVEPGLLLDAVTGAAGPTARRARRRGAARRRRCGGCGSGTRSPVGRSSRRSARTPAPRSHRRILAELEPSGATTTPGWRTTPRARSMRAATVRHARRAGDRSAELASRREAVDPVPPRAAVRRHRPAARAGRAARRAGPRARRPRPVGGRGRGVGGVGRAVAGRAACRCARATPCAGSRRGLLPPVPGTRE